MTTQEDINKDLDEILESSDSSGAPDSPPATKENDEDKLKKEFQEYDDSYFDGEQKWTKDSVIPEKFQKFYDYKSNIEPSEVVEY